MKIFCIAVFMIIILFMLHKNKGMGSMYNGILIGGFVYYGFVPLLNELNKNGLMKKNNYYVDMDTEKYIMIYFMIIIFFCFFYLSSNGYFNKRNYVFAPANGRFAQIFKAAGFFCLIVGGLSLALFFAALGGISTALSVAEKARSFTTSLTDFMPYYASLLIIPARLVMVAPYFFCALTYMKGKRYRIYTIISLVLAVLFCLFNAGRAPLLALILCFVVPIMLKMNIRYAWTIIMIIGVVSMPLLDVLDQLYVYFQKGTFELTGINLASYLNQFSYPINNVFHAFDIGNKYGYRFGKDFITCVLDILPGFTFEPSYVPTSEFIGGARWKVTGGTPNDIITLSILEFHVLGLVIVPWVLGKISKFVDEFTHNCTDIRVSRILAAVMAVNSFLMVANSDPVAIFRAFIMWMIPLTMVLSTTKERKNRGQVYNE